MELSRQMLLLAAENYGSYYLHITISLFFSIDVLFGKTVITSAYLPQ